MEKNISKEAWEDVAKEFIAARELRAFNEGMLHIMNNKYALRDYFAAKVMQGMLAGYQGNPPEPEKVVEDAYYYADQMLKVRGSNGQT